MDPLWFPLVIVGSGPAGLSASVNATQHDIPHVLLEQGPGIAQTIRSYSTGKLVMAEPVRLPTQGNLAFAGGTRESVLNEWQQLSAAAVATFRLDKQLEAIQRQGKVFRLRLHDGTEIYCEKLVLALGLAGRPRRLEVSGADPGMLDYGDSDWPNWRGAAVVVVGAGDSAIEAALTLAPTNSVTLVNRGQQFERARRRNIACLKQAQINGAIEVLTGYIVEAVFRDEQGHRYCRLRGQNETRQLRFDQLCVRIGALPNRQLLEECGVRFRDASADSLPILSSTHETSVPGIYVIGSLAGCRLIKPCINQGWEVVQALLGSSFETAPQKVIRERFGEVLPGRGPVELLNSLRRRAPLYADMDDRTLEELLFDSGILLPEAGTFVLRKEDHTDAFYVVLAGSVLVEIGVDRWRQLGPGACFGERSLLTGQRRSANVKAGRDCVLIENPRLPMVRAMREHRELAERMNSHFLARTLAPMFGPAIPHSAYIRLARQAIHEVYPRGESVLNQGESGRDLFILKRGGLSVRQGHDNNPEQTLAEIRPGECFGEHGFLTGTPRAASVIANLDSEVLRIAAHAMSAWLVSWPSAKEALMTMAKQRYRDLAGFRGLGHQAAARLQFLHAEGMTEATSALVIDSHLCIGCDQCEQACAETHQGVALMRRAIGPDGPGLHLPEACRHCSHPACMDDCPPLAISRDDEGRVSIAETCIACGNCIQNCPYGAIRLLPRLAAKPPMRGWRFWSQLLFGTVAEAPKDLQLAPAALIASKCDACAGRVAPACVTACPTGAAIRIHASEVRELASEV